ncbi:MAG: DUF3892 domain-containing protein [Bdellovibrionales bacterium]|nr:DUF3892 domain-containing protein [Bdellovibrionales bacterium]
MNKTMQELKSIWKRLGIKGQVRNYSSKAIWVIETDSGRPVAHLLAPMTKSPNGVDADAFRRVDGKPIQGHKSWWKIYDFSTAEIFDKGDDLKTSALTQTAVMDDEFGGPKSITYDRSENWGVSIQLVDNVQRNKKKRITKYHVTGVGWVDPKAALTMTCNGEIDNARPVFPGSGNPYIRTRRDRELSNNLEVKG